MTSASLLFALTAVFTVRAEPVNLALGKPYVLDPAPSYRLCTDPDDAVQLTDGTRTKGFFWMQQSTVGWEQKRLVTITVDLGQDQPIAGVSYGTAAAPGNVEWPVAIRLLVSLDNRQWYDLGDLIQLATALPPATGYAIHDYRAEGLKTHGRYVKLMVKPVGNYFFGDELEVFAGGPELLLVDPPGKPLDDVQQAFTASLAPAGVWRQITADRAVVAERVRAAELPKADRNRLLAALDEAAADPAWRSFTPSDRAVLPLTPGHAKVFGVQAELWRRAGQPELRLWANPRYDRMQPTDPPGSDSAELDLRLMRGEVRAGTFNLTNSGAEERTVELVLTGLPGTPHPPGLSVCEVPWTGVAGGGATCSALPEAERTDRGWRVTVPSGLTRQVWLGLEAMTWTHGDYQGAVELSSAGRAVGRVPIKVHVSRLEMPKELSLSLGGWDYTDGPGRGVTDDNLDALVTFLRRYHVTVTWASQSAMPFGEHAADGKMTKPPDTARFDAWLARWPEARYYCVYWPYAAPLPDTAAARLRLSEWARFWAAHAAEKGVRPGRLLLLLVDEPMTAEQATRTLSYSTVIKAAAPDLGIFGDPFYTKPDTAPPDYLQALDMICPHRPNWVTDRPAFESVYLPLRQAGKTLAFYSAWGPVHQMDPYSYHRLQAWDCFRYGATVSGYWSFGDNGRGSPWNEYGSPGSNYAPEFLTADSVLTAKAMEAIREGLYDHEYLVMLRDKLAATKSSSPAVEAARRLLATATDRVFGASGADKVWWRDAKDRTIADQVRQELLAALESL